MKLNFVFLFVFLSHIYASSYSQTTRVSLDVKDARLEEVLWEIQEQTNMEFFYSVEDIKNVNNISVTSKNEALSEVLKKCLKETGLTFDLRNNVIVLHKSALKEYEKTSEKPQPLIRISGVVTDEQGETLPNANIFDLKSKSGTTTDVNGKFSILINDTITVLNVSYIGFETKVIKVNSSDTTGLIIVLKSLVRDINEVVITGIFEKKKDSYTGAITTISEKELKMYGSREILSTINIIDPSFKIKENNKFGSDPNRLPEINIRGTSSIPSVTDLKNNVVSNLNTPLFIMDGFEISLEAMRDLNIEDVKNITILKDASATAIYGSRGANGVVVITSKKPEAGKLKLTCYSSVKMEFPDLSGYDLLNAREKLDLEVKAGIYEDSRNLEYDFKLKQGYSANRILVEKGINTDWMAKPLRVGIGQKHHLRLEGGDERFRYSLSVAYDHFAGVMKGSNRNSFNGLINLTYNYKNLKFRNQLSIGLNKSENSPFGTFIDYVRMNPYWAPYNDSGKLVNTFVSTNIMSNNVPNPLYNASIHTLNQSRYEKIRNNFSIEWKLLKGLTARSRFGITTKKIRSDHFKPGRHTDFVNHNPYRKGKYIFGTGEMFNFDFGVTLSYSRKFLDKHQLYCGFNYDMAEISFEQFNFAAEGFPKENFDFISIALQYEEGGKPTGFESKSRRIGITGNINYSFNNRYFLDFSVRTDGSSQFGSNKRFAPFWSMGLGWNLHNEEFFDKYGVINKLKIIGSYGTTGSQQFAAYQAEAMYKYYINDRYIDRLGAYLMGLGNKDLEWQTTKQVNVGFESELLNKRLRISANAYYKSTSNLLSQMNIPLSHGFASYPENIGEVKNIGFEIMVKGYIIKNIEKGISWSINGNLAHNENRIVNLSEAIKEQNEIIKEYKGSNPNRILNEGDPLDAIYVVPSLGIDPSTGKELYRKKNGNITYEWDANDRVFAGINSPDFFGVIGSTFNFKNIQVNLSFDINWGGQIYNQTLISRVENADKRFNVDRRVYENRWMKPGDITFFKGINETGATRYSSRFVQDQTVFQCKNIDIAYRLDNDWVHKSLKMKSLKFSCNLNNLFYLSSVKRERGLHYPYSHNVTFSLRAIF